MPRSNEFSARYDEDSEVLVLAAASASATWPYGATVDGLLTLDLDEDRVLANVELMWPQRRWPRGAASLVEGAHEPVAVRLPELSSGSLKPSDVVTVSLSPTAVVIRIRDEDTANGSAVAPERAVLLGNGIQALLAGDVLVGFAVRWPPD